MMFQVKGLGAEPPWKLVVLGLALAGLAVAVYFDLRGPSEAAPAARVPSVAVPPANPEAVGDVVRAPAAEARQRPPLRPGPRAVRQEFKLGLRDKPPDPASIDPTLRLDLLAKVQAVKMAGGVRNLFQFGAAPLPPTPERKIVPIKTQALAGGGPTPPPTPVPTPPPPPIPLKFYGYATPAPSGAKRVFFLDGDDIIVAEEGQVVKSRYKVVRIGINSVVVEDVQFRHQQTLPLEEQAG